MTGAIYSPIALPYNGGKERKGGGGMAGTVWAVFWEGALDEDIRSTLIGKLSPADRARYETFPSGGRAGERGQQYLLSRALLAFALEETLGTVPALAKTAAGQPYFPEWPGLFLSLSHTEEDGDREAARRRTEDGELVKQDPDDYLKYHGAEAFERLLSGSENGIEFRMAQVAGKYDLSRDEDRVAYAEDVSALLSTLPNAVEREICTARAAEAAHISAEAMKLEVQRAMKRRAAQERKAQQRKDLNPAAALQPAERSLRYENLRSARAEEGLLRLLTLDASLFPAQMPVTEEQFSSPLLGKAFRLLWQQREAGRVPQAAALAGDLEPREMDVISGICQQPQSMAAAPQALADYIRVIQQEYQKRAGAGGEDPLRAAMEKYRKSGNGGKQA